MFFPLLVFAIASLLPAGKFALHVGDVYEWNRQDLLTLTETTTRVTVLDSGISDSLPADSGKVWRLKIEPASALPETLQLFEFKNGALRWLRGSANFPVEFESPDSAAAARSWNRGGYYWGMPGIYDKNKQPKPSLTYNVFYFNIVAIGDRRLVESDVSADFSSNIGFTKMIQGVWTDSLGPIWFNTAPNNKEIDWSLVGVNGIPTTKMSPRIDSVRALAESFNNRLKLVRLPSQGDSFIWEYKWEYKPSDSWDKTVTITNIKAVVTKSLNSNSERTLTFKFTTSSKDGNILDNREESYSIDSLGMKSVPDQFDFLAYGWHFDRDDVLMGDSTYKKGDNKIGGEYLASGVPLRGRYYSINYGGPCGLGCQGYVDMWINQTWTLLSAPGYTGINKRPHLSAPERLTSTSLRVFLATDPDATVRWSNVAGRSGQQPLSDFMKTKRQPGAMWLQVTTTSGRKLEGMFLGL